MLPPDLQRIEHIRDYCAEIENTIDGRTPKTA